MTSARKFELNNDFSCPNIKEKWPTSANSMPMFCAITSLLAKLRKSLHMAFEDDTTVENTRPFIEILSRLEPVANFI